MTNAAVQRTALALAGLFLLTSCQSADETPPPENPGDENAPTEDPGDENALTITGAEETDFEPTSVRCSGEPGNIQHIIASTDNQPPLLRVAGPDAEFALYQPGEQGPPHRNQDPSDITLGEEDVTFDEAGVGDVVVSGELTCTEWEQDDDD